MSSCFRWAFLPLSVLFCACVHPIHKTDEFAPARGVRTLSIDAKQRIVLFAPSPDHPKTDENGDLLLTVTCAEPSPDALSALSSSLGAGASDAQVAANLALAQVESAASIGLRTPSIQLLRDGMYRLCEGYAAGATGADDFNQLQRRYQNLMLSLLAIEQLTGTVEARQVGLGQGSSSASVGDNADQAAANLAQANSDASSAQTALTKAQNTQTADEKACSANASSAACGKAATDETAVTDAQTALDKAKAEQKTAQEALQAARSSVKASAAGAQVSIADATPTNHITDASAQAIAEATRTIVSTTLLGSFAQEECNNVWTFLKGLSDTARSSLIAQGSAPAEGTLAGQIVQMAKNCQANQKTLLNTHDMFTPERPVSALQVLNVGSGVTLAPEAKVELSVVGGLPAYRLTEVPAGAAHDVSWSLDSASGNTVLTIQRVPKATGSGKTAVSVLDSSNAHVEIPVTFTAATTAKPTPTPSPAALAAPTNLKAASAKGEITVEYTPSKSKNIKGYAAVAIDNTDLKVLTASGDASSKSISVKSCVADHLYAVSVEVTDTAGHQASATVQTPVKCMGDEAAKPAGKPAAAKNLQGACKRGTIELKFDAAADGGSSVLIYSATAQPKSSTDKTLKATGTTSPIRIPGCAKDTTYAISLVSTNANGSGPPATASVECKH